MCVSQSGGLLVAGQVHPRQHCSAASLTHLIFVLYFCPTFGELWINPTGNSRNNGRIVGISFSGATRSLRYRASRADRPPSPAWCRSINTVLIGSLSILCNTLSRQKQACVESRFLHTRYHLFSTHPHILNLFPMYEV